MRVVTAEGETLGILPLAEARREAQERGQDLIEIAAQATPPVCKIMDYGKFRYQQTKRQKETQKKSKHTEMKAIRIRPNTGEHDVQTKVNRARKFLGQGNKVKFDMIFRGAEMRHIDIGHALLKRVAEDLGELAEVERGPRMEGRRMHMILAPAKTAAKAEAQT